MAVITQIRCLVCHKQMFLNVNDSKIYSSQIVRDNYVCVNCQKTANRIKVSLKCSKCSAVFHTRIFMENGDKYKNWTCPTCSDGVTTTATKLGPATMCSGCKHKFGVCIEPQYVCKTNDDYVSFASAELCSAKGSNDCTVLSVDQINKGRDDIHCFRYTLLYRSNYKVASTNLILVKQRVGSRKKFVNKISLFGINASKFHPVFNKEFERGVNWVLSVRDFIRAGKLLPEV